MATINQLMTALRSADAAGATNDAQRIAQIIANQQRSGPRDSGFGYSVDRAQQMFGKGVEVVGDLVGSDTVKSVKSEPRRATKAAHKEVGSLEEKARGPRTLEDVKVSNRV